MRYRVLYLSVGIIPMAGHLQRTAPRPLSMKRWEPEIPNHDEKGNPSPMGFIFSNDQ
jgi:hypothetical protein